jgi:hypothetical protein
MKQRHGCLEVDSSRPGFIAGPLLLGGPAVNDVVALQ